MDEPRFRSQYKVSGSYVGPENQAHAWFVQHVAQEVSIAVTERRGFDSRWYLKHGAGWVMRRFQAELVRPWLLDDEVTVETWLSTRKRLSVFREYRFADARSGALLGGAEVEWVFIRLDNRRPAPVPDDLERRFSFVPERAVSDWDPAGVGDEPRQVRAATRLVRYSELDGLGHANNVVYLRWVEDLIFDQGSNGRWLQKWKLEYRRPARLGDEVLVRAALCEPQEGGAVWQISVQDARSSKDLVRGYVLIEEGPDQV